jgi:hypothetical protein
MNDSTNSAIRMFCIVHNLFGEDGVREFHCLNPAIQDGWLKLAKETRRKLIRAVNDAVNDEHEH